MTVVSVIKRLKSYNEFSLCVYITTTIKNCFFKLIKYARSLLVLFLEIVITFIHIHQVDPARAVSVFVSSCNLPPTHDIGFTFNAERQAGKM